MIRYALFTITLFVLCCAHVYAWSKMYKEKIIFKSIWLYISLAIMLLLGCINYFFVNVIVRMIFEMLFFFLCNFMIFRKKHYEIFVSTIYGQFLLTLSDVICALIVMIIFGVSSSAISDDLLMKSVGNILISIVFIIIASLPFVTNFYYKLLNLTNKIKLKRLFIFCLLIIISINYLMVSTFYEIGSILVILINTTLIVIYSFIVYRTINERNNSLIVKAQNESLMESLNEYENMVDRQRVDNHENKNQLLIIKNMIKKKDINVVKYIDTIVKDEKEDDEVLYTRVKNIPTGGLQGIIYQKMLTMKDNKILFSLSVSRDVRKINLEKLSMSDNYKLCKIVGVLLDNAIEASLTCKDKRIMISLYIDDEMLIVEIANKYCEKIDLENIDKEGYTTKGDGHGYGLSLVKEIISESNIFINERKVTKDIFKQTIKIDLKNI